MTAQQLLDRLAALKVAVVVRDGRPALRPPSGDWKVGQEIDRLAPVLREHRDAVLRRYAPAGWDRDRAQAVLEDMDGLVAASGVPGTHPEVQAVAASAVGLYAAEDADALGALRECLRDALDRLARRGADEPFGTDEGDA